jgi:hypothetical protein
MLALSLFLLAAPAIDAEGTQILTAILAEQVAKDPTFDVISSTDVRRIIELEGQKQALGCSADSCLAEVAGALGARFAIYGNVGRLGSTLNMTVSCFDAQAGRMARRMTFRGASADALASDLEARVHELVESAAAARGDVKNGERTKVVVLDVRVAGQSESEAPAPPPPAETPTATSEPLPLLGVVGGGVAALGAAGLVLGGVLGAAAGGAYTDAGDAALTQKAAAAKYDEADGWALGANVAYVAGGVLLVGGVALAVTGFVGASE